MLKNIDKAPFPWFGGKSKAAPLVWSLLGDVAHYVEPFCGSCAVLLGRPHPCNRTYYSETVNDADGLLVNALRGIQMYPDETAAAASWPVSESCKHARQIACLKWRTEKNLDLLAGTPEFCDPKIAGWWMWGVSCQIGAIAGPWTSDPETGRIIKQPRAVAREPGVSRNRPHLNSQGVGVNRPQAREPGVRRDIPHLSSQGQGVNSPQAREPGIGHWSDEVADELHYHPWTMPELRRWFAHLAARMRHVRIVNGDWRRVCTHGAIYSLSVGKKGPAGVFLDPPYAADVRSSGLYTHDGPAVAAETRAWCIEHGRDEDLRIALAGFDTEHTELEAHGWTVHEWFRAGFLTGGMANVGGTGKHQQRRERIWASPACLVPGDDGPPKLLWETT